jgi:hypothetical protein
MLIDELVALWSEEDEDGLKSLDGVCSEGAVRISAVKPLDATRKPTRRASTRSSKPDDMFSN